MKSIVEILGERGRKDSKRIVYTFLEDQTLKENNISFGALDSKARCIADKINSVSNPGDRVLLLFPSGTSYIEAFWGTLYSRAIAVPAYPPRKNKSIDRLMAIIKDSGATIVLTTSRLLDDIRNRIKEIDEQLVEHFVAIDLLTEKERKDKPILKKEPDDIAFLQYTSGSTGNPKGVQITHRNIIVNEEMIKDACGHSEDSVCGGWLPFFHDMGLIANIIQPVYAGCKSVLISPVEFIQRPLSWLKLISKYRLKTSGGPDFGYDHCVQKIREEDMKALNLSSWEAAFSGAEPISYETLKRFEEKFGAFGFNKKAFSPCYGMAETTLMVTRLHKDEEYTVRRIKNTAQPQRNKKSVFVGCGTGFPNQKIAIVNPKTHEEVSEEEIGEVWVNGEHVAAGYWNRPALSEETFGAKLKGNDKVRYLKTGDLGFIHENQLYITGRIKDIIIIGGVNFYPQDIEKSVFNSHEAFKANCCATFIDDSGKLTIVQELERTWLRSNEHKNLRKVVSEVISKDFELSAKQIVFIKTASLPKTSSGKIQRSKTKLDLQNNQLNIIYRWDKNKLKKAIHPELSQQSLIEIISEATGISKDEILPDDTFDSLGLDSVGAVNLIEKINATYNKAFNPTTFYNYPTIEKFLQFVEGAKASNNLTAGKIQKTGELAIIGYACKFPKANNTTQFWNILYEGKSAVTFEKVNNRHLPDSNDAQWHGGFINTPHLFDGTFFNISRLEAEKMDPQQRTALETSWHAFENAGIDPAALKGKKVGVFIGCSSADYSFIYNSEENLDAYYGTGNSNSITANRISFFYDFTGPSMVIDTACSSSLSALNFAKLSLYNGECDLALVGGINLLLNDNLNKVFTKAGMLSNDGKCKVFDDSADGYIRGEGCGFIVLKNKSLAEEDGDKIHAVLKSVAVNQDGKTNGLTAPNGESQKEVIKKALQEANLSPEEIDIIEAHGTGTSLGDPIEVNALIDVFGRRAAGNRLILGSVKANIGHLEAAAGMAGIIKALSVLKHRTYPRQINLNTINKHIHKNDHFLFPKSNTKINKSQINIGISSFGFGGTNGHAIIQSYNEAKPAETETPPQYLLKLSAKSKSSFFKKANVYLHLLSSNKVSHTHYSLLRGDMKYCKILTADSKAGLISQLERICALKDVDETYTITGATGQEGDAPETALSISKQNFDFETLPNYPFDQKMYWYPESKEEQKRQKRDEGFLSKLIDSKIFSKAQIDTIRDIFYENEAVYNSRLPVFSIVQEAVSFTHENPEEVLKQCLVITSNPLKWKQVSDQLFITDYKIKYEVLAEKIKDNDTIHTVIYDLNSFSPGAFHTEFSRLLKLLTAINHPHKKSKIKVALIHDKKQSREPSIALRQAVLGLPKVLNYELENLHLTGINFDDLKKSPGALAQIISNKSSEEIRFAVADNGISVSRLEYAAGKEKHALRFEGLQLITGGFGAIAQHFIAFLVSRGGTNILLNTRSMNSAKEHTLQALRDTYPEVEFNVIEGCISKKDTVLQLSSFLRKALIPLKGVFHLAGVSEDILAKSVALKNIYNAFNPKIKGTKNLHLLSKEYPLDYFVCFSSIASVLGIVGQSVYATANAYQNSLMALRRKNGLAGTAILWGLWEVGMATQMEQEYVKFMESNGVKFMPSNRAFTYLEHVLEQNLSNIVIAEFDHELAQASPLGYDRIFNTIWETDRHTGEEKEVNIIARLQNSESSERRAILQKYLKAALHEITGTPEEEIALDQPLIEMGLDSLMTVKLNHQLQKDFRTEISISDVFEDITAEQLIAKIGESPVLTSEQPGRPIEKEAPLDVSQTYQNIEDLSEMELDNLIQKLS